MSSNLESPTLFATVQDYSFPSGTFDFSLQMPALPPDFVYFHPLNELDIAVGQSSPVFQYWCSTCGQNWQPQLVSRESICGNTNYPIYICFSYFELDTQNLCDWAFQWIYSLFYGRLCERGEGPCEPA